MSRTIASLAVLAVLFAHSALARAAESPQPPPLPGRGPGPGQMPAGLDALMAPGPGVPAKIADTLGIPEDKLKKIRDAAFAANDELITLEASAKRAQLQLDRLLSEPAADEKQALTRFDEVFAAELAVRKNRVRLLMRVRTILGPDLWQKVQQAQPPFEASSDSSLLRLKPGAESAVSIPGIERVALGDPKVADIRVEAGKILVTGSSPGKTTMLVWVTGGQRLTYLIDVRP